MKKNIFEICVYNAQSAVNAEIAGADRIELCDSMFEGGTTPGFGIIKKLKEILSVDINVMIRPRGGDFLYSDLEFEIMKEDILRCHEIGVNGVVFGLLNADGTIDMRRTSELVELARPLKVTFHRAFDLTPDLELSLNQLIEIRIDKVLTSGGRNTAIEGILNLKKLVNLAENKISIMPGSGINAQNIKELKEKSGAKEFHFSGKKSIDSQMKYRKHEVPMGGFSEIDEYKLVISDVETIRKTINALNY